MKRILYSAAILLAFAACNRQKNVVKSDASSYTAQPAQTTTTTTTTQVTTGGTTEPVNSATSTQTLASGETVTTTTTSQTTVTGGQETVTTTVAVNPQTGSTTTTVITANDTVVTTVVAPVQTDTSNLYRVTVSFISKGEGIDRQSVLKFEEWVKSYPKSPVYLKTRWGREGETNYCLKLAELSTREQVIFVRDLRTLLTDKELVLIDEYAPCKGRPAQD
jgi:hypothetical protein